MIKLDMLSDRFGMVWQNTKNDGVRVLRMYGTQPEVEIPETVSGRQITEIGEYCFAQTAHFPAGCETIAHPYACTELSGSFLKEVRLSDGVKKIGNLAFYNCTGLKKLEFSKELETVGSDAFMNCRNLSRITVRCGIAEKSGVRQVLSQISSEMEVTFFKEGRTEAVVLYPEYYETYDEIAPAHLFGRNIEGEGFRARQCFKDGIADLTQYDTIFPKACVTETPETLGRLVCTRLHYPAGMTEKSRALYEAYLRKHEMEITAELVRKKDIASIRFFCKNGLLTKEAVVFGSGVASEMDWAEGVVLLLHLKQEFFKEKEEGSYTFEDF